MVDGTRLLSLNVIPQLGVPLGTMTFDDLYISFKRGQVESLTEFLEAGGNPNLTNKNGWSLLMAAAFLGKSRIVEVILHNGAEVNLENKFGDSALALGAAKGHLKSVEALLLAGASVAIKPGGRNFLNYLEICACTSQKVKNLLVSRGAV